MEYDFVHLRFYNKENLEIIKTFLGDIFVGTTEYFYANKIKVFALLFKKGDGSIGSAFLDDFIVNENNNFVVYDKYDFYEKFMILGGTCKIEE